MLCLRYRKKRVQIGMRGKGEEHMRTSTHSRLCTEQFHAKEHTAKVAKKNNFSATDLHKYPQMHD